MFKSVFKKKEINIDKTKIPKHIAIVMDGNGRWAKNKSWRRTKGHQEGANNLKTISNRCDELGVNILTVYAFSTENWKRPKIEVEFLMELLLKYLKDYKKHLGDRDIKINVIGNTSKLSQEIQEQIKIVKDNTKNNKGLLLNISINYGSRHEILTSVKRICSGLQNGDFSIEDIDEDMITDNLYTNEMEDVDLFIRPGGEKRISNFLLWQSAYAELYFTDVLWPDFNEENLDEAILEYQLRNRRFGGV